MSVFLSLDKVSVVVIVVIGSNLPSSHFIRPRARRHEDRWTFGCYRPEQPTLALDVAPHTYILLPPPFFFFFAFV